ncbi:hypothetical protein C0J52_27120 [Blattella germanica]|nr:hypothetical protein C0J52_27120 [Blattella germanica]
MGKLLTVTAFFLMCKAVSSETLVWQDEFDSFNLNEWKHLVTAWDGGNSEFQYYRNDRKNSYVRDGILYIIPTLTSSERGDDFLYSGTLSYPDCNMEPCSSGNKNNYDENGMNQGIFKIASTLHWGPDTGRNNNWRTHWEKNIQNTGRDFSDDFHLFGFNWVDNRITFTVDNQEIGTVWAPQNGFWYFGGFQNNPGGTNIWQNGNWMAPFDKEFQFVLNVAVGGKFFPDGLGNRPWSWNGRSKRDFWEHRGDWQPTWNGEDAALKIDYIRVYKP